MLFSWKETHLEIVCASFWLIYVPSSQTNWERGRGLNPDLHLTDLHCPPIGVRGPSAFPRLHAKFSMNANLYTFLKKGVSERVL